MVYRRLEFSLLRFTDMTDRKIYYYAPQSDMTTEELIAISYFVSSKASMGGYDWGEFVRRHKLERHFKEEE